MRSARVVVRVQAGPAWTDGPPEAQAGWDAHARFVDGLVERGTFVMGGPFSDYTGSLVIMEGIDVEGARRLMDEDPFTRNGVFLIEDVREWIMYVDRTAGERQ